jgi:hypothetical protein
MTRELVGYRLRAARNPPNNRVLSSTVAVRNEHGQLGYCYVSFADQLPRKVGLLLPYGISEELPGMLEVVYVPATKQWLVKARYVDPPLHETLLWRTLEKPKWLNFYRKALDETRTKETHPKKARTG